MDQLSRLMSLRIGARYDAAAGYHLLSPDTIRSMRSLKQLSIRTYEEASLSLLSRVGDLGPRLLHLELNIVMFWSFDISDAHNLWWVARIINSSTAPTLDIFITVSTRVSQALLSRSGLPALEDILIGTDNSPRTWTLHIYSEETPEPWFIDTMKILMPRLVENDRLMFHDDRELVSFPPTRNTSHARVM
ncbi:hypothetical protein H0H92_015152 [Tricholoma furcatifolium]|nr:hypothetical protein H0H92_015152 [Tricholoma furcatifolium]